MNSTPDNSTSYDTIPYESHPYSGTHPDHLASLGKLFGMDPPPAGRCRVLELGCAAGGNIVPLAVALPESHFLGIDLSARQIDEGRQLIESLGLKNIELAHRSIADVGPDDGVFDYIICHGVYSWVTQDIQDKILEICSRNLSPQGIAYISYNTYPGWFMRGMVRRMMCHHARQFDDPQTQVRQARALLDFLIDSGTAGDAVYHALLRREAEIIRNRQDSYLFHEHLEDVNEPVFFHEFIERAETHQLRYLAETQFSEMVPGNFSPQVETTLRELGAGLIHSEQYLDFLRNRTFRRTLLCHDAVPLNRQLGPERLTGLSVSTQLKPLADHPDLHAQSDEEFRASSGPTVTVSVPLLKSALARLGEMWPCSVRFDSLPSLAYAGLGTTLVRDAEHFARDQSDLGSLVLELYAKDLVQIHVESPWFAAKAGIRPLASPLARQQAEQGSVVTTLLHEMTQLSDLGRHILRKLDGTQTTADLISMVKNLIDDGELVVEPFDQTANSEEETMRFLDGLVSRELDHLAQNALLLPESDSKTET